MAVAGATAITGVEITSGAIIAGTAMTMAITVVGTKTVVVAALRKVTAQAGTIVTIIADQDEAGADMVTAAVIATKILQRELRLPFFIASF
ncbi:hypothetical protein BADSM9389_11730 [Buttiauxella agrestis]|nr:hypothetical protein BADSM9389_11730 [Buttiauxella agrestis]